MAILFLRLLIEATQLSDCLWDHYQDINRKSSKYLGPDKKVHLGKFCQGRRFLVWIAVEPDCLVRECAQCASHARASQQGVAESDVGNISKPASRFERGIYQNNRTNDKVQKVVI